MGQKDKSKEEKGKPNTKKASSSRKRARKSRPSGYRGNQQARETEVKASTDRVTTTVEVAPGVKVSQSFSLKALFEKIKAFFRKLLDG